MDFRSSQKKQVLNYKQFGSFKVSFPGLQNLITDVKYPEHGEFVMVPATESVEAGAARGLRSEHKSKSLLPELMSGCSQPRDLVVDNFERTFSTAVACFMVPSHRVSAGCEADSGRSSLAKKNLRRHFAKTALDAGRTLS